MDVGRTDAAEKPNDTDAPPRPTWRQRAAAARETERHLQRQRHWAFRAMDGVAVTALVLAVTILLLAGRVLERREDMSGTQSMLMANRLMRELASEQQLSGYQRVVAFDAAIQAFNQMQERTEPEVDSLADFVSDILFYSPERNNAVLEARKMPDLLPGQMEYMMKAPSKAAAPPVPGTPISAPAVPAARGGSDL